VIAELLSTLFSTKLMASRRRHEFGTDWIFNKLAYDSINFGQAGGIQLPSHHAVEGIELIGLSSSPKSGAHRLLIEYPAQRQMNNSFAIRFSGKSIQ
jgi:hypothetical protein